MLVFSECRDSGGLKEVLYCLSETPERGALLFALLLSLFLSSPHTHILSLFLLSTISEGNISKCALSQSCLNAF